MQGRRLRPALRCYSICGPKEPSQSPPRPSLYRELAPLVSATFNIGINVATVECTDLGTATPRTVIEIHIGRDFELRLRGGSALVTLHLGLTCGFQRRFELSLACGLGRWFSIGTALAAACASAAALAAASAVASNGLLWTSPPKGGIGGFAGAFLQQRAFVPPRLHGSPKSPMRGPSGVYFPDSTVLMEDDFSYFAFASTRRRRAPPDTTPTAIA